MNEPFKQHGAFSWCELITSDVEAAKTFYTKLFGWDTEEMTMRHANLDLGIRPGHDDRANVIEQHLGARNVLTQLDLVAFEGSLAKTRLCRLGCLDEGPEP